MSMNLDLFETVYNKQKELYEFYKEKREWYKEKPVEEQLITFTIAMLDEGFEFLHHLNWKPWKNEKPLDKEQALEELIDVLHFWMQLIILLGATPEIVKKIYLIKNKINKERQLGKADRPNEYKGG